MRYAAIHGQIAIHDRSGEDHTFWRSASITDLTPLSEDLALAIRSGSTPPDVLTAAVTAARADTAGQPSDGDLTAALERRVDQHRSVRPSATAQRIRSASRPAPAPPAAVR